MQILGQSDRVPALAEVKAWLAVEEGSFERRDGLGEPPVADSSGEQLDLLVEDREEQDGVPVIERAHDRR